MFLRDSVLPVWVVFAVIALRKSTSAAQKQALLPDKISTLLDTFLKVSYSFMFLQASIPLVSLT